MSEETKEGISWQVLSDRLDHALSEGTLDQDFRATSMIAIAFCDLLFDQLNEDQQKAVDAARQFWAGENVELRSRHVSKFSEIIDLDRQGGSKQTVAFNRLVWTALNVNTGLSSFAGDFLIGLGKDAGLRAKQIEQIFIKYIPGFYEK